jgi:hypothetical protein
MQHHYFFPYVACYLMRLKLTWNLHLEWPKAGLSGSFTNAITKVDVSAFQHDEFITLNAQFHEHNFIDKIQHLSLTYVDQMCHVHYVASFIN